MFTSKCTASSMRPDNLSDDVEEISQTDDLETYRSIEGNLLYLSVRTTPDTGVAASSFGSYVANVQLDHLINAKQSLQYHRGTTNVILKLPPGVDDQLHEHMKGN